MNDAETLSKTILLRELPKDQLQKLASISEQRTVNPGTEVLREGQTGDELLVILMGTVKVTKKDDQGRDEELAVLGSGSYVGELELVSADHENAATVTAQENTTLVAMKRGAIESLCERDPAFGYHFYRALSRGLSRRLALTDEAAAHFKGLSVRARG